VGMKVSYSWVVRELGNENIDVINLQVTFNYILQER
jgi:hypothetical protein